jgi:GTP cyclohydrolase IA
MNSAIKRNAGTAEDINLCIATDEIRPTEAEKIERIQFHFQQIMEILGLDLTDDSLKDTPARVAKLYVKEIFQGLNPEAFPEITLFNNSYGYTDALIERDIQVYSYCEHHFVPFIGRAHVAYIPSDKVIGLSKLNRIVKYFARRPQVQERLTNDIATSLKSILNTDDVAVYIEARHFCISSRGVEDTNSATITTHFSGRFKEDGERSRFYSSIRN